jgi:PhnB protein
MRVEPYLYFNGRCEEAIEFYRRAVGAKVVALTRFKDSPGTPTPAGAAEKIMHADFRIGDSTLLASDGSCSGATAFQGFSLSLTAAQEAEAEQLFAALSAGGQVEIPLISTPFAARFGTTVDRFGVRWTITARK